MMIVIYRGFGLVPAWGSGNLITPHRGEGPTKFARCVLNVKGFISGYKKTKKSINDPKSSLSVFLVILFRNIDEFIKNHMGLDLSFTEFFNES